MFTLTIETENAAFDGYVKDEVIGILTRVIEDLSFNIRGDNDTGLCRDSNGNRVGQWELTTEEGGNDE